MKTKNTFFTIILLAAALHATSQIDSTKSKVKDSTSHNGYFLALGIGCSIPLSDITNWGKIGTYFNFSSQVPIKHSNFGIAFMFGLNYNGPNTPQSFIKESYSNGLYFSSVPEYYRFLSYDLLLGGFAAIPVDRFSFDLRILFGLTRIGPTFITAVDAAGNLFNGTLLSEQLFSTDLGVGIRYKLSRALTLLLDCNYIITSQTKVNYSFEESYANTLNQATSYNYPAETISASSLNISFGIGVIL